MYLSFRGTVVPISGTAVLTSRTDVPLCSKSLPTSSTAAPSSIVLLYILRIVKYSCSWPIEKQCPPRPI